MTLTLTPLLGIPDIRHGDNLADIILNSLGKSCLPIADGDVFVLAQKIVSKAEGRMVNLSSIVPSSEAIEIAAQTEKDPRLVHLILSESKEVLRTRPGTIIVQHKLGFVCANAGIDHSNVHSEHGNPEDWVLLLPENPDRSANLIRGEIETATEARIGILIIDSHGRAWRNGTIGMTIGLSGMPGLVDLRGHPDLYEYKLRITTVGAADELAAAASLVMGQANEGTPVVHARGFPYPLREGELKELIRPKEQDLFR